MQHIQVRLNRAWHFHWCLVVRWNTYWDHDEPWCTCRPMMFHLCPFCPTVNRHPEDRDNRYCGRCHVFADDYLNHAAADPIGAHRL